MKVMASVKRICRNCKVIKRHGVVRVICTDPRSQTASKANPVSGTQRIYSKETVMARIAGINIPPQQHAEIGLTAILASVVRAPASLRSCWCARYQKGQGSDRRRAGAHP